MIGLTLAAPVGPIAIMCIRRTVASGRFHGIASGIGVATADSFYAAVAVLGLTIVSNFIIANQAAFRIFTGIVLCIVGIRICMSAPPSVCPEPEKEPYIKDYLSMTAITLSNPLTILFFVAVVPGFGIVFPESSVLASTAFVIGVFCGSVAWWIFLCGFLGSVRKCITSRTLLLINRISGILIFCFGAGIFVITVANIPYSL